MLASMSGKRAGRLGDRSKSGGVCGGAAHAGSGDVLINGKAALRVGDVGSCKPDCKSPRWVADDGAPYVLVNHRRLHRLGDPVEHGSKGGELVTGSADVLVGDAGIERPVTHERAVTLQLSDGLGRGIHSAEVVVRCPHKPDRRLKASGPELTISGLCDGATIKVVSPLEDHEWC